MKIFSILFCGVLKLHCFKNGNEDIIKVFGFLNLFMLKDFIKMFFILD